MNSPVTNRIGDRSCPESDQYRAPEVHLSRITRCFGPMVANDSIDLHLKPATIHALVGENGAGKSTLMRILFGLLKPDHGRIEIDGRPVSIQNPASALAHGIGMIHQHFMLVPTMTVLENIIIGSPRASGLKNIPVPELRAELKDLFAEYKFDLDPDATVESLSIGGQQRVEIARLLFRGARLLICDEPTSVLAPPEVAEFFIILKRFRAEGRTVVFITHKLTEVLEVADYVTVLRRGRVVGEASRGSLDQPTLVNWIMGGKALPTDADDRIDQNDVSISTTDVQSPAPLLQANAVSLANSSGRLLLDNISFEVRPGEIIGIAGVVGNGQKPLSEVISGRSAFTAGSLTINNVSYQGGDQIPHPQRPALIPQDRSHEGLISELPLWENLLLGRATELDFIKPWWYSHSSVRRWVKPILIDYRVQPADANYTTGALSGGNQQKVLCAREMTRGCSILVACQPTRGIDITSTRFLHRMLREFAASGGAVVLISADLDEIMEISDRIGVIYRGRFGKLKPKSELDLEMIGRSMVGLTNPEDDEATESPGGNR